jgi:hypothetical protein
MSEKFIEKLSPEDRQRLKAMALENPIATIKELQNLTNCSLGEGKSWVDNEREEIYLEHRRIWLENLPPCPYCGEKLRTPQAKQCRFCLRDWHDENELKWLKQSPIHILIRLINEETQ